MFRPVRVWWERLRLARSLAAVCDERGYGLGLAVVTVRYEEGVEGFECLVTHYGGDPRDGLGMMMDRLLARSAATVDDWSLEDDGLTSEDEARLLGWGDAEGARP